jgi:putative transposase
MLADIDLLAWYQKVALPAHAAVVIDHIRHSDPARRVGGGCRNVSGRYPSKKMGVTIQFESHRVELAAVYELEHDAEVLEYFDQPPSFKLDYNSADGRHMGILHTADYFVVRKDCAGWEECKTEKELVQLNRKNPNRYRRDEHSRWTCPPGEAYAAALGLYYRVRSSQDIDWVFQRNIQFLEDYLRGTDSSVPSKREVVLAAVAAMPGISLEQLFEATASSVSRDAIYFLIASGVIYVDLSSAPLMEPTRIRVFTSKGSEKANQLSDAKHLVPQLTPAITIGSNLTWDGKGWKVLNVGETLISLLGDGQTFVEMPLTAFEHAVKGGHIVVCTPDELSQLEDIWKTVASASERELQLANQRLRHVVAFLREELPFAGDPVPSRTLRRWVAQYQQAAKELGSGYLGLLPRPPRGNATPKLPEDSRALMNEFIQTDYENLKQKTRYASWIALKLACDQRGILAPSFRTFCRAVQLRPGFEQTLKRRGPRAAYAQEDFCWELALTTPRHGDRPFEIAHIDHTELDVETICSRTGRVLGRPWMTLLTDAFSRRILALYLTFDPPSYRSCMMSLRECVRRFARLPQIVVVDGGREFHSVYFETLLARYECMTKTRPAARPRFGSICERLFGTANTQFIHNLKGNTQITRSVRQVTQSVNPKGQAVWSLEDLHRRLSEYLYEIYDVLHHPTLGQSPRAAYETGIATTGQRTQRIIAYDREFLVHTLPTTNKGTAKIAPGRGVKIHNLYYWADAFRAPDVEKLQVPVRYDPFDAGTAYAFVNKQWTECHSEYFTVFHGRSEKEMMLATQEMRKLSQGHSGEFTVTSRKLAEFLESVQAEELLLEQRLTDAETQDGKVSHTPPPKPGSPPERDRCEPTPDFAALQSYGSF